MPWINLILPGRKKQWKTLRKSGQVNTCEHLDHVCRVEWKSYESAQVIVCRGSDSYSDMKSRVDPKMPYKWGKRSSKPGFCDSMSAPVDFQWFSHQRSPAPSMSRGPLSEAKSPHARIPPKNQNNSYNTQEVHNKTVQRHGTFFLKEWKKNTISCSLLLSSVVGTCQACQAGYRWLQARWATGLPASSSSISRICSYGSTEVLGPAWNFGGNSLKLGWNRLKHVETAEHQILF